MAEANKQNKGNYYEDFVKPVLKNNQITWKGENYEFIFDKIGDNKILGQSKAEHQIDIHLISSQIKMHI